MTKTASRGGLRAAAEEKRNRHAQRTPLPPKPGAVAAAREAIEEAASIQAQTETPASASDTGASKSWQKAAAYASAVEAAGWTVEVAFAPDGRDDDIVEATAKRGTEVLWISWTAGKMTLEPMPTYTVGDRTIKLKNASACKQYAARPAETATAELSRVQSNRFFRRKPTEPKRSRLPFDPATALDEEVIEALAGRSVSWHNSLTQTPETALMGEPRKITLSDAEGGDRIVSFCSRQSGFRAFRLSALISVSGGTPAVKRSGGRIVQEGGSPKRSRKAA